MKLSVAILAKNAEAVLEAALMSVDWADEVVVGIDETTTDKTAEIAKRHKNVKLVQESLRHGFGRAKNSVIEKTSGDWVLIMDADERVTPELKTALQALHPDDEAGFYVNRLNYMLGRPMRHGGWWPDYQLRLVAKGRGHYSDKPVHEEMVVEGKIGRIEAWLEHLTQPTLKSTIDRINLYSDYEAQLICEQFAKNGRKIGMKALIGRPARALWRRMIARRAWRDGVPGYVEAVSWSFYELCNYAKAWELQRQSDPAALSQPEAKAPRNST